MTNKQLLTNALKENFGFDTFKGNQEAIMLSLLDGDDVFVQIAVLPAPVAYHGRHGHRDLSADSPDEEPG